MYLRKLLVINFRNYQDATLDFSPAVNCFTGVNGSGKTNILDAIHYLSMTKSYFSFSDSHNIRHGDHMLMIQGEFDRDDIVETVLCGIRQGQKKQFKRNQKEYDRLSDHIGEFPVVMIAPTDQELITEGSEIRRKFIDSIISQYDHNYLEDLIRYNQVLSQRNTLLKQAATRGLVDNASLSVWDDRLVYYGERIYEKRKEFISGFEPLFNKLFTYIADSGEIAGITYESQLHEGSFSALLQVNHDKDLDFQYTTHGIHKDDLVFTLKGFNARRYASQGQQKSLVIALKLAHYNYLCKRGFARPIVLLDDIFDKLDEGRVARLMQLVSNGEFGQLFITDTHRDRIQSIFASIKVPVKMFSVQDGTVIENSKMETAGEEIE
jgi:DNA replication and repair protein RecF